MFKLPSTFLTPPEKGPSSHVNMFSICCVSLKVSWRDGEIIELCTEASGSFPVIIRYQISTYVIYGPPANIIYLSLCFFMDRSRLFYKQLSTHKCSIKVAKDWIRNRVWYRKRPLCQLCKQPTDFMLVIQFFTQQTKHPRRRFCSIQV